jgi:cytoskeleton protein RodZ
LASDTDAGDGAAPETNAAAVAGASVPETTATAIEAPASTPGLSVELRFIEDSWAEITTRDNERVFYGLGRAGSEARFTAAPPVAVLLGNADGVDLLVEGEAFPYPVGSRRGKLARFTLTASAE